MRRIEVRDALPGDALAIADAHVTAWQVGYRGVVADAVLDDPAFREARITGWTRRLTEGPPVAAGDPDNRIFVGLLDGRVVGFGHAGLADDPPDAAVDAPHGEVYGFYVHPDAWGSGVADALMTACIDELRARGFGAAVLWTLRDTGRSRRFYERSGWTTTGRELMWDGPVMPGAPTLSTPLAQVEYRISLG